LGFGGFGDSTGVATVAGLAEAAADAGTGVEDATGVGKDEAGGAAPTLADCAAGLPTACAKTLNVKKLRVLRIKETLFINNVIEI
jgi:hypothetical protein